MRSLSIVEEPNETYICCCKQSECRKSSPSRPSPVGDDGSTPAKETNTSEGLLCCKLKQRCGWLSGYRMEKNSSDCAHLSSAERVPVFDAIEKAPVVELAVEGQIGCDPNSVPIGLCPDGTPCPATGPSRGWCPKKGEAPVPVPEPEPAPAPVPAGVPTSVPDVDRSPDRSPVLVWQKVTVGQVAKVEAGFNAVQKIKEDGVIDAFMASQPKIKDILWNYTDASGPSTVKAVMDYCVQEKLVHSGSLEDYMKERNFTLKRPADPPEHKRSHWVNGDEKRSAKAATDYLEQDGPNNGYMRVFFHDVAIKLRQFNSTYGWDDSLLDALSHDNKLYLINKHYDKDWDSTNTPRKWILPQMHYLGIFANDIAGDGQNFAITEGEPPWATPVDLDATWRDIAEGHVYSFLKLADTAVAVTVMERNYLDLT